MNFCAYYFRFFQCNDPLNSRAFASTPLTESILSRLFKDLLTLLNTPYTSHQYPHPIFLAFRISNAGKSFSMAVMGSFLVMKQSHFRFHKQGICPASEIIAIKSNASWKYVAGQVFIMSYDSSVGSGTDPTGELAIPALISMPVWSWHQKKLHKIQLKILGVILAYDKKLK